MIFKHPPERFKGFPPAGPDQEGLRPPLHHHGQLLCRQGEQHRLLLLGREGARAFFWGAICVTNQQQRSNNSATNQHDRHRSQTNPWPHPTQTAIETQIKPPEMARALSRPQHERPLRPRCVHRHQTCPHPDPLHRCPYSPCLTLFTHTHTHTHRCAGAHEVHERVHGQQVCADGPDGGRARGAHAPGHPRGSGAPRCAWTSALCACVCSVAGGVLIMSTRVMSVRVGQVRPGV